LLLQVVQSYATQTAARGSAIVTMDALNMLLIAVLVFLILRQIMPIAAGLAGGLALSTLGAMSRTIGWGMRPELAWLAAKYAAPRAMELLATLRRDGIAKVLSRGGKASPGERVPTSARQADIDGRSGAGQ
jgi:hypothetical protein